MHSHLFLLYYKNKLLMTYTVVESHSFVFNIIITYFINCTGKVLKTTLSLYCELNQPFPSMDEVVICTSETTTEDVSYNIIAKYCNA